MRNALVLAAVLIGAAALAAWIVLAPPRRNVVIFVADGLRYGVVNDQTAPELMAVRREGVDFADSHSLYPTVTTPNASAIATGHYLGDTGDFSNMLYVPGGLPAPVSALVTPVEDDAAARLLNGRFGGNFLNEQSFLAAARAQGYQTAVLGKLGPVAVQDLEALEGKGGILIDDNTGWPNQGFPDGAALPAEIKAAIKAAGLKPATPDRGLNSDPGAYNMPGVRVANVEQQDWLAQVASRVLLPLFKRNDRPFVLVFWSRDPDGTQHGQGDSLGTLTPGINGPTSMASIRNASRDLGMIRKALHDLGLEADTDVFVTADHGFSTLSRQSATSAAAKMSFRDVVPGQLPPGFLAIDLSLALGLPLHDANGLDVALADGFHPKHSSAILGDARRPSVVFGINGGTDEIWLEGADKVALAHRIVTFLTTQDYLGALFVRDDLGPIGGALPTSAIGFAGSARTRPPDIIVSFRSWSTGCADPEICAVEVADNELQQGQGIHGAFHRGDTRNFMAAIGPDFRRGFVDRSPISNADIAPTLAHAIGLPLPAKGRLTGRVIGEALARRGSPAPAATTRLERSAPAANGFVTVLKVQTAAGRRYFDAAGMPGRTVGLEPTPKGP